MRKIKVCSHCLSSNVTQDALSRWSVEDQKWELSGELDNTDCDDCGGQTRLLDCPEDNLKFLRSSDACPCCGNKKVVGAVFCGDCVGGITDTNRLQFYNRASAANKSLRADANNSQLSIIAARGKSVRVKT